jgi:hypothetical protein
MSRSSNAFDKWFSLIGTEGFMILSTMTGNAIQGDSGNLFSITSSDFTIETIKYIAILNPKT